MLLVRPKIILGKYDQKTPLSLRQVLSATPSVILICFSILYLSVFQYYRQNNFRDPTSYFFDPSRAYERIYSAQRIKEADIFLHSASSASAPGETSQVPEVCIGVITVKRRSEQYVGKTIGSLLEGLDDNERNATYLDLLIGHTDPSIHPIHNETWVQTLPDNLLRYEEKDLALVQSWEDGGWYRNKSIYDYTFLMKDCYSTGAKYIMMVEDDTLAMRGWYPRTLQALKDVEAAMRFRDASKWIYLRLFYAEVLFGWNSEYWAQYLTSSIAIWLFLNVALVVVRRQSKILQSHLSNLSILTLSCVCLPAIIALHFMAGRNSVLPLAPGIHEMNKYGCCSQGYVFPREIVPTFLNLTDLETDWLVDMMVEKISDEQGFVRWATTPALLQHIGTTSSKGYGFDDTAMHLWNFGFELHRDTPSSYARSIG